MLGAKTAAYYGQKTAANEVFSTNAFYLTRESQTYYLAPGEVELHRECQSKRFIPKIMFMCAVANPNFLTNGDVFFNGQIGI